MSLAGESQTVDIGLLCCRAEAGGRGSAATARYHCDLLNDRGCSHPGF